MNALKTVVQKWKDMNAILRILIGLVIGLALGLLFPNMPVIGLLGSIFVGSLKGIAPILVFVLIMSSLANSSTGIGSRFRTVIFLYMTSTFVASIVAVITSYLFPVTMKLTGDAAEQAAPTGVGEVWTNLLNNMVTNPVSALANANYIGILFWAVLFGLALKAIGSEKTNALIAELADMINKVVTWIILLAPFGVMGLVFNAVSENGLAIFTVYGKLVAALVGSMLFVTLVTDPFIASLFLRRNPYPLTWTALKESGLTAFFTRSSAANIPVNMALLLGVHSPRCHHQHGRCRSRYYHHVPVRRADHGRGGLYPHRHRAELPVHPRRLRRFRCGRRFPAAHPHGV